MDCSMTVILGLDDVSFSGQIVDWERFKTLTLLNYSVKFDILLFYEELQMEFDIRTFDMPVIVFLNVKSEICLLLAKTIQQLRNKNYCSKSSSM